MEFFIFRIKILLGYLIFIDDSYTYNIRPPSPSRIWLNDWQHFHFNPALRRYRGHKGCNAFHPPLVRVDKRQFFAYNMPLLHMRSSAERVVLRLGQLKLSNQPGVPLEYALYIRARTYDLHDRRLASYDAE